MRTRQVVLALIPRAVGATEALRKAEWGRVDLRKRMSVVALYGIEGTRVCWQIRRDNAEARGELGGVCRGGEGVERQMGNSGGMEEHARAALWCSRRVGGEGQNFPQTPAGQRPYGLRQDPGEGDMSGGTS